MVGENEHNIGPAALELFLYEILGCQKSETRSLVEKDIQGFVAVRKGESEIGTCEIDHDLVLTREMRSTAASAAASATLPDKPPPSSVPVNPFLHPPQPIEGQPIGMIGAHGVTTAAYPLKYKPFEAPNPPPPLPKEG